MWRNFGCGEICLISWVVSSEMSSQVNWWHNFAVRSFFMEFLFVLRQNMFCCNLRYFVAKPVLLPFTHFLCGDKFQPKCCPWRKNDNYQHPTYWTNGNIINNFQLIFCVCHIIHTSFSNYHRHQTIRRKRWISFIKLELLSTSGYAQWIRSIIIYPLLSSYLQCSIIICHYTT